MFGTVAKWAIEIDDASRVSEIVARAWHIALSGRPGPVVIALPEDMLIQLQMPRSSTNERAGASNRYAGTSRGRQDAVRGKTAADSGRR